MSKALTYSDAVRLLGGQESKIVAALDRLAGGVLLGVSVAAPALLALLDAKAEFARLGHQLVREVSEHRSGLSRYRRTQRLEAAHTVLVVTAFFDAMEVSPLPFQFDDLQLTMAEQLTMAGGSSVADANLMRALLTIEVPLPAPQHPREVLREHLLDYYQGLASAVRRFLAGLALGEQLSSMAHGELDRVFGRLAHDSCVRYEELFLRLAVDFPEVAFWANANDHQATRHDLRSIESTFETAFSHFERVIAEVAAGVVSNERRAALAIANQAVLDRPIVLSGDVPVGLRMPTLAQGYITPTFQVGEAGPRDRLSEESWWSGRSIRDDLEEFLTGYLTSPQAAIAPLLVLGQPGSGKSVLTRVLAATLPAGDFLPVRVVLREVAAAADLQDQIEQSIRNATGEAMSWPALARSAAGALPTVILDGFDELLQATGVNQTDYLTGVASFQRREAEQGRPVAVIVTSRLGVADRARAPEQTVAIRLQPFDEIRIRQWLHRWNTVNLTYFESHALKSLTAQVVLRHPELARQPLLLLMLALYDATSNALQRDEGELLESELYEQLMRSFARREVVKHHPELSDRDLDVAIEQELRRLSVVAYAMFNRASQWVTESDLDIDLLALFGPRQARLSSGLRAPLRIAEIALGSFFFVHKAEASQDEHPRHTYEFLHATFGEYLVARFAWQALQDVAARQAASTMLLTANPIDDDLLHTLLSFAPLCARAPILDFLVELTSELPPEQRIAKVELLLQLFRNADAPRSVRTLNGYEPRTLPVPARHAAYSANLFLLMLCIGKSIDAGQMFANLADRREAWVRQTLLWRSQLSSEDWNSMVGAVAVDRIWSSQTPEIRLSLDDGTFQVPMIDPYWSYGYAPDHTSRSRILFGGHPRLEVMRRKAYFQGSMHEDVIYHALEPMVATLGTTITAFAGAWDNSCPSIAHALVDAWLIPLSIPTPDQRSDAYQRLAKVLTIDAPLVEATTVVQCAIVLLHLLTMDDEATPELAVGILETLRNGMLSETFASIAPQVTQCVMTFLGLDHENDYRLVNVAHYALTHTDKPVLKADAAVRLLELDHASTALQTSTRDVLSDLLLFEPARSQIAHSRPDLIERMRTLTRTAQIKLRPPPPD